MPNSRQSIKRHRNSIKKQKHNTPVKRSIKTTASQAASLAKDKKKEESLNLLNSIYSKIDKAVKNGILHKKNAARKKSRIAKALHSALAK